MRLTIHQPEHLPWLGLIEKIRSADCFVILDTVQFSRGNFQHRNKIRNLSKEGYGWLTVPFSHTGEFPMIIDTNVSYSNEWQQSYLNKIKNSYKKAEFFSSYFPIIEGAILKKHNKIAELNIELMKFILNEFGVTTCIVRASEIDYPQAIGGSDTVLSICRTLNADVYISGSGGRNYLVLEDFDKAGIKVEFQDFHHPTYEQQYAPFISHMSSIDLLFNHGREGARKILFKDNPDLKDSDV